MIYIILQITELSMYAYVLDYGAFNSYEAPLQVT